MVLLDAHMPEMDGFTVAEVRCAAGFSLGGDDDSDAVSADLAGDAALSRGGHRSAPDEAHHLSGFLGCYPDSPRWHRAHAFAALPTVSPCTEPGADRPLHILLAEDNRITWVALHTLEKQGHTVVVVGDGQAALGRP